MPLLYFMTVEIDALQAKALRSILRKVESVKTFAVGAYVPQGESHPVLVPMVWHEHDWAFCGPVVRRGEPLFETLAEAFRDFPVWLYHCKQVEIKF